MKAFRIFTQHQTPPQVLPPDIREALGPLAEKKNVYYGDFPPELMDEMWRRRFRRALEPLRQVGKLGAALFQFPPWSGCRTRPRPDTRPVPPTQPDSSHATFWSCGGRGRERAGSANRTEGRKLFGAFVTLKLVQRLTHALDGYCGSVGPWAAADFTLSSLGPKVQPHLLHTGDSNPMTKNSRKKPGSDHVPRPQTEAISYRYRYLMGAMPQLQLTTTIRVACIPEDASRLPDIVEAWRGASARMLELAAHEAGAADQAVISEPPAGVQTRLGDIGADPLFRSSFSDLPISFKVVELDTIVAPQREVNLDYVDSLRKRIPGKTVAKLVEFCVGPRTEPPDLKVLQTAQNQMTYSSRSLDLRFLGGYPKPIGEDDIRVAHM